MTSKRWWISRYYHNIKDHDHSPLPSAKSSQPSPSPLAHRPEPITFACAVEVTVDVRDMIAVVIARLRVCCLLLQLKSWRHELTSTSPSALDCESCSCLDMRAVYDDIGVKEIAKLEDKATAIIMRRKCLNMVIVSRRCLWCVSVRLLNSALAYEDVGNDYLWLL